MDEHPEKLSEGLVRRKRSSHQQSDDQLSLVPGEPPSYVTPFNAGDAMAKVMEEYGEPVPRRIRPRLARAAKELLEDGFSPQVTCVALMRCLYRARVDLAEQHAMEIQNAMRGNHLSYAEDRSRLEAANRRQRWEHGDDPITQALRKEVESELQRR